MALIVRQMASDINMLSKPEKLFLIAVANVIKAKMRKRKCECEACKVNQPSQWAHCVGPNGCMYNAYETISSIIDQLHHLNRAKVMAEWRKLINEEPNINALDIIDLFEFSDVFYRVQYDNEWLKVVRELICDFVQVHQF